MKLIITRHGETEENKKKIVQGHLPGKLSELGIEQGKKLAFRLKNEKIDIIYSSDLRRAADTAKFIAEYHKDIPLVFTKELRERDYGNISGKKLSEVDWNNLPKNCEPLEELQKRVIDFLDKVYHKYPKSTVLFVSHGSASLSLIKGIKGKKPAEMYTGKRLKNTSLTIFEIKEDKNHKIHLLNCTEHLK